MVAAVHAAQRGVIEGYWVGPGDVLAARPAYKPTGAIQLHRDASGDQALALDMVSIEGRWVPLSDAGRYTYAHSSGLLRGERWQFVFWDGGKRQAFDVTFADSLPPAAVAEEYGAAAAADCRPDRPAVQLRLRPAADAA